MSLDPLDGLEPLPSAKEVTIAAYMSETDAREEILHSHQLSLLRYRLIPLIILRCPNLHLFTPQKSLPSQIPIRKTNLKVRRTKTEFEVIGVGEFNYNLDA
jgi:hypothetical protein